MPLHVLLRPWELPFSRSAVPNLDAHSTISGSLMMRIPRLLFAGLAGATLALATQPAMAAEYTLSAVQDTSITQDPAASRTLTDNGTGLKVRRNTNADRAAALIQFDLSGVSGIITEAYIQYYDTGEGGLQGNPFTNDTYLVYPKPDATPEQLVYESSPGVIAFDQHGMHQAAVTYNSYGAAVSPANGFWIESPPVSSLNLSLDANNPINTYFAGGLADSSVLAGLNAAKDNLGYIIVLSWYGPNGSVRLFDDIEGGNPPQLVLTTAELTGDFNGDGSVNVFDYWLLRDNMQGHLDGPVSYSLGDINFDGKIDLDDFGQFKSIYPGGAAQLTADLAAFAVPEPSTLVLLGMAGCLALALRRGR